MSIRQPFARPPIPASVSLFGVAFWIGCAPTELGDRHAALVEAYLPTPFTPEDALYADPEQALGPPDGRTVALGDGAYLSLRFFRPITDDRGPDLRIYEIGPDGASAKVAVSTDGQRWVELPGIVQGPTTNLEISGLEIDPVFFVRVRGLDLNGPEPGFDLDAAEALH